MTGSECVPFTHSLFPSHSSSLSLIPLISHFDAKLPQHSSRRLCCKASVAVGRGNGTDFHAGAPAITCSLVDFLLVSTVLPHARHNSFKLRHKMSTSYAFQSQSFPSSLPRSFILLLWSSLWSRASRTTLTVDQAAATRHPYALSFITPFQVMCLFFLFIHHHRHPRGRLYDTRS